LLLPLLFLQNKVSSERLLPSVAIDIRIKNIASPKTAESLALQGLKTIF
jgi:hypothetical protein